ncbi:UNVERIFIED_CONTAM: hypothetical protein Slati_3809100 [Sesamum latifolium]|uniref:Uncharacterized protein n=1 Tax=Sesamum latifolium TaxID=2727402 RepID=A0AAW2U500_9LAMI
MQGIGGRGPTAYRNLLRIRPYSPSRHVLRIKSYPQADTLLEKSISSAQAHKPSFVEASQPSFEQALRSFSRQLVSSVPCRHLSPPLRRHLSLASGEHLILPLARP